MSENSPAGLTLLAPDRTVVGTRGECHQPALQAYAPLADGRPRNVVVELALARIEAEHQRGRRGIEIRLDGERIGELSALASARYGRLVDDVLFVGGRPACVAKVVNGPQGVEVELRLPEVPEITADPPGWPLPGPADARPARPARRTPYLVGAGIAALLVVIGVGFGRGGVAVQAADGGPVVVATTTAAPVPAPPSTVPATTTRRTPVAASAKPAPAPAPQPAPEPEAEPDYSDGCDPNYGDCVPVADDVDCDDGSGDGPVYVSGPVQIIGADVYDLDPDGDGTGCD